MAAAHTVRRRRERRGVRGGGGRGGEGGHGTSSSSSSRRGGGDAANGDAANGGNNAAKEDVVAHKRMALSLIVASVSCAAVVVAVVIGFVFGFQDHQRQHGVEDRRHGDRYEDRVYRDEPRQLHRNDEASSAATSASAATPARSSSSSSSSFSSLSESAKGRAEAEAEAEDFRGGFDGGGYRRSSSNAKIVVERFLSSDSDDDDDGDGDASYSSSDLSVLNDLFPDAGALAEAWENYPLLSSAYRHKRTCEGGGGGDTSDAEEEECGGGDGDDGGDGGGWFGSWTGGGGGRGRRRRAFIPMAADGRLDPGADAMDAVQVRIDRLRPSVFFPFPVRLLLNDIALSLYKHRQAYVVMRRIKLYDAETGEYLEGRNLLSDKEKLSEFEVMRAIDEMGFSFVFNGVERDILTAAAQKLERDIGVGHVSIYLFLTPPAHENVRDLQAVEDEDDEGGGGGGNPESKPKSVYDAQYNWQDVIVVQVRGTKLWSVGTAPSVYLPLMDDTDAPTKEQLREYHENKYEDFLMRPGDVLYIPRGYTHNASTIPPSMFERLAADYDGDGGGGRGSSNVNVGGEGSDRTFGKCTTSSARLTSEPSLHLSYSIEPYCEHTVEVLLHRVLDAYVRLRPERNAPLDYVCSKREMRWYDILHVCLSEWTRRAEDREGGCSSLGEGEGDAVRRGACALRRTVSLSPLWRTLMLRNDGRRRRREEAEEERGKTTTQKTKEGTTIVDPTLRSYLTALDGLAVHGSGGEAATLLHASIFIKHWQVPRRTAQAGALTVQCLPVVLPSTAVMSCPPDSIKRFSKVGFRNFVDGFVKFARTEVAREVGMEEMVEKLKERRPKRFEDD